MVEISPPSVSGVPAETANGPVEGSVEGRPDYVEALEGKGFSWRAKPKAWCRKKDNTTTRVFVHDGKMTIKHDSPLLETSLIGRYYFVGELDARTLEEAFIEMEAKKSKMERKKVEKAVGKRRLSNRTPSAWNVFVSVVRKARGMSVPFKDMAGMYAFWTGNDRFPDSIKDLEAGFRGELKVMEDKLRAVPGPARCEMPGCSNKVERCGLCRRHKYPESIAGQVERRKMRTKGLTTQGLSRGLPQEMPLTPSMVASPVVAGPLVAEPVVDEPLVAEPLEAGPVIEGGVVESSQETGHNSRNGAIQGGVLSFAAPIDERGSDIPKEVMDMVEEVIVKEEPVEPTVEETPVALDVDCGCEKKEAVEQVDAPIVDEVAVVADAPIVDGPAAPAPADAMELAAPGPAPEKPARPEPQFARGDEVVVMAAPDPEDGFFYENPQDVVGKKASVYDDDMAVLWNRKKSDWMYLVQTEDDAFFSAYGKNLSKAMAAPEAPPPASIIPEEGAQTQWAADDGRCQTCGGLAGACACASMSAPDLVKKVGETAGEAEEVVERTVKGVVGAAGDVVGGTLGMAKDVVEEVTHPKDWVTFLIGAGLMASPLILALLMKKPPQQ